MKKYGYLYGNKGRRKMRSPWFADEFSRNFAAAAVMPAPDALTQLEMSRYRLHTFTFDVEGFVYSLSFRAASRAEADAMMRETLHGSSFERWLAFLLPVTDEEIEAMGSIH